MAMVMPMSSLWNMQAGVVDDREIGINFVELVASISPVERSSHGGMVVVKLESTCGDCTVNISVERLGQCRLTTARSSSPCDNGGAYVGVGRSFSIG